MAKLTMQQLEIKVKDMQKTISMQFDKIAELQNENKNIMNDKNVVPRADYEALLKDLERADNNYKIKNNLFDKGKIYINELKEQNTILKEELEQLKNKDSVLINSNTIEKKHNERGAGRTKKELTEEQKALIQELHLQGKSYGAIAKEVNLSKAYIYKLIKKQ